MYQVLFNERAPEAAVILQTDTMPLPQDTNTFIQTFRIILIVELFYNTPHSPLPIEILSGFLNRH